MKHRGIFAVTVALVMILALSSCSNSPIQSDLSVPPLQSSGQIYLYGEIHDVKRILDKEFELWYEYYHDQNMRHLFVELPYYTAEFLNIWMQSDSNDILDRVYNDWTGTSLHSLDVKEFYEKIKSQCPETIFHGTDVGHQNGTTGMYYLEYLKSNKLEGSEQHLLAQEAIEQGRYYYGYSDGVYRENMMVENFIREFDKLNDESIMGIYGAAHTGLEGMDYMTKSVPSMANQLEKRYGDTIHSEDLSSLEKDIAPYTVDTIKVGGKDYEALYFGEQDLTGLEDYTYREFWRLEDSYDDFKDSPKTQEVLPYDNYPMMIETGQVFVIDYTKTDGSVIRSYYRSDGKVWNDKPSTEAFTVE